MPKRKREEQQRQQQPGAVEGNGADGASLAFQEQQVTFKLSLLPHALEDMARHVHSRLNGLLMRYNEEAGGVLLSLANLRLPTDHRFAAIMGDLPHLHVHVSATALVFTPQRGAVLAGRVIKVARTHVALLVHGIFNAAIAKEDMPSDYRYHHPHDHGQAGGAYWVRGDGKSGGGGDKGRIAVGDKVSFRVLRVHEAAGLISLDGTLRQPGDDSDGKGEEEQEGTQAAAATGGSSKSKRKSSSGGGGGGVGDGTPNGKSEGADGGGKEEDKDKKKKKKKKEGKR